MSSHRSPSQEAALEAFKRAIRHGEDLGYPDNVKIIALDGEVTPEKILRLFTHDVFNGRALIFVRRDGAEIMIRLDEPAGVRRWVDHARGRARVRVMTRKAAAPATGVAEDRYIHRRRPDEMQQLVGACV